MVKGKNSDGAADSSKPAQAGATARKMVVLVSMILIGILLIIYKSNYTYWADQFITFNTILLGISALLLVLISLTIAMNLKRILLHELKGFVIFLVGALIFILIPSRNYLGLSSIGEFSTVLYVIGGIIIIIGAIVLMRLGGFISVCFFGVLINTIVAAYYVFINTGANQYTANTLQMIDLSILFFIISFCLLIYHDLKFFYLANLLKEEKSLRKKKEYKKALLYCEKSLRIYPNFATAWNNKGNILFNMDKKVEAIKCYKKALTINPDYLPAKKNLKLLSNS